MRFSSFVITAEAESCSSVGEICINRLPQASTHSRLDLNRLIDIHIDDDDTIVVVRLIADAAQDLLGDIRDVDVHVDGGFTWRQHGGLTAKIIQRS